MGLKNSKKIKMLNNEEVAVFCEQLAMMMDAAIMPADGVWIMLKDAESEGSSDLKYILETLVNELQSGKRLHEAMITATVFPKYCTDMIRIGEDSGKLTKVMHSLAFHYNREHLVSDTIKSSLKSPLIMIFVMFFVVLILVSKVLPIFNDVYIQLGTEMTGFSRQLLLFGNMIGKNLTLILGTALLLMILALILYKTNKNIHDRVVSGLSGFFMTRRLSEDISIARFASGMALTWNAGLSLEKSLEIVSAMIDYKPVHDKIINCLNGFRDINNTKNFSELLVDSDIFNPLYSRMIQVSGKSGSIETALEKIATKYDEKADKRINNAIALIEPALVISFSIIICVILLSVMLPLMNIMKTIG
ncbi:MAG: type II secretion system F family protein [Lachnospiraceae bacterium]|nr:type II secretion system F family protein [Lachnospiraceae bacterium]